MILLKLIQKFGIWIVSYVVILLFFYNFGIKEWLPYVIFLFYFLAFILIIENLSQSELNRDLLKLFKYFYLFNTFILFIPLGIRIFEDERIISLTNTDLIFNAKVIRICWVYMDISSFLVTLFVSIYLFLFSLGSKDNNSSKLFLICAFISVFLTLLNFFDFIVNPESFYQDANREIYNIKSYLFNIVNIMLLLFFWFRYYRKYFVLSEYLDIIIFMFMLSQILQALFYIVYQHDLQFYKYSWYFDLTMNFGIALFWYIRLDYLNSPLAKENEKYIKNLQFLDGIMVKPKQSFLQNFITRISLNYFLLFFVMILIAVLLLYFAQFINLFLMLNTIFILITALIAIFFSVSSIKRDWKRQYDFLDLVKSKNK